MYTLIRPKSICLPTELRPTPEAPIFEAVLVHTYPSCTGPMEAPAVRASSVIKARVIDSVVWFTPPSC